MLEVINPATNTRIARVDSDTASSVRTKVERARGAQRPWAALALDKRKRIVARFRDLLVARNEELAQTLTQEVGKPIAQARAEVAATPARIDFFLEHVEQVTAIERVLAARGLSEEIHYEPLGVVANISAWNYPYFVGSNVFVPALLTGNAVVYKPSELATLTGQHIAQALWDAGVSQDAFGLLIGGGDVGAALSALPIDGMFFTGSYATGQRIAEAVAPQLKRVQLELGGKDPLYVCDDADAERAAALAAEGAFYNTGQSCCAVERVYVHRTLYDRFVACFVDTVRSYKVGDPKDPHTFIGPLARPQQAAVLEAQVSDAVQRGGQLVLGGKRMAGPGFFFAPTVVTNANATMRLMRDESFGPVIGIQQVDDDDEAVRLMNDTDYGLTAAVVTPDAARARRILAAINAGTVYWNCCDRVSPRLPWTGRNHSGLGSTLSVLGIRAFVQPKAWHLKEQCG